jgi:hypothetical protein
MTRSACFFAFLLVASAAAMARPTTGSISGVVLDETSARMPGATIVVRQLEAGVERTQTSDPRGRYRVII